MIKPSAPVAIAPFARGSTYFQVPAAWLGSSTIGKWTALLLPEWRSCQCVPCGCLEGSDASFAKYYIGITLEIIYSAAINHSSMVAASPFLGVRLIGHSDLFKQPEVLHVSCTDLDDVCIRCDKFHISCVHNFGDKLKSRYFPAMPLF